MAVLLTVFPAAGVLRELDRSLKLQPLAESVLGRERFFKTVPGPFRVIAVGQTENTPYVEIEVDADRAGCYATYDGGARGIETKQSVTIVAPVTFYSPRFRAPCFFTHGHRNYRDLVALNAPLGTRTLKGKCIPLGSPCEVTRSPFLPPTQGAVPKMLLWQL